MDLLLPFQKLVFPIQKYLGYVKIKIETKTGKNLKKV